MSTHKILFCDTNWPIGHWDQTNPIGLKSGTKLDKILTHILVTLGI